MTSMCDLSPDLVGEILSRTPMTSLRAVRSTCKSWDVLSKEWVLGKAAARQQFLGFITMEYKLCSVRFDLQGIHKDEEDLVYSCIKQIDRFDQVEISEVFHCDGLVLCVTKDRLRHLVWNPYLGQVKWILPRRKFHSLDKYALGHDKNRNHKILRLFQDHRCIEYEIYDFSSDSWKVLDVTPDWRIRNRRRGVTLKGNTYFLPYIPKTYFLPYIPKFEDFLLCFDFTRERFGHLPLTFHSYNYPQAPMNLSCVREEKLVVLCKTLNFVDEILEVWVTNEIEPNTVSWSKFLKVDVTPFSGFTVDWGDVSFFIDEEKKVAVVFFQHLHYSTNTYHHKTYIIGEDECFKSVSLIPHLGCTVHMYRPRLVSTSYLLSLVQII